MAINNEIEVLNIDDILINDVEKNHTIWKAPDWVEFMAANSAFLVAGYNKEEEREINMTAASRLLDGIFSQEKKGQNQEDRSSRESIHDL